MAQFCLVTQKIGVYVEDGPDEDDLPDRYQINGKVTFTPNITAGDSFKIVEGNDVVVMPAVSITADIINGQITHNGKTGIYLFAAGENSNPTQITYTVAYTDLWAGEANGAMWAGRQKLSLRELKFLAVPNGAVDLGEATPVAGTPGAGIVQGAPGLSPHVSGGTWWIGEVDTGVSAVGGSTYILPEDYGAVRDGVTDDIDAIEDALSAASVSGGTVLLRAGQYAISRPIGSGLSSVSYATLVGEGDVSSSVITLANTPVVGGKWFHCTIRNVHLDAAGLGSPGVQAHFDKVTVTDCFLSGWTGYGMFLNPEGDDIGLLNRIINNHIVQGSGVGIFTTYRFVDSWIDGNNIGSTGPNISIEAGPLRVVNNHLNGTPIHNIELRGNQRITIGDNIMEGARCESIIYTMPPWLTTDMPQIQITGNALSNGGKEAPGTKPAIGIYGIASDRQVAGFSIVGNIIACQDHDAGWSYAVKAHHAREVTCVGNQWGLGYQTDTPVGCTADSVITLTGNTVSNSFETIS